MENEPHIMNRRLLEAIYMDENYFQPGLWIVTQSDLPFSHFLFDHSPQVSYLHLQLNSLYYQYFVSCFCNFFQHIYLHALPHITSI